MQQRLARLAFHRVEAERDRVAVQQIPDLVGARGPLLAHHPHHLESGPMRPGPVLEQLGNGQMESLVRHRHRPGHVIIDVTERDGLQDLVRRRPVAPFDQQQALGRRVIVTDQGQEFGPGYPGHRLAGQHDADLALALAQPGQQADRVVGGSSADDLVIGPVPVTELGFDHAPRVQIVVDDQQDRGIWRRPYRGARRGIHCNHDPIPPRPVAARGGLVGGGMTATTQAAFMERTCG